MQYSYAPLSEKLFITHLLNALTVYALHEHSRKFQDARISCSDGTLRAKRHRQLGYSPSPPSSILRSRKSSASRSAGLSRP